MTDKLPQALVAEDTVFFKEMFRKYLTDRGFEVHIRNNGDQAYRLAKDHDFDLIIVDWLMPVMDGLEFVKKVRQLDRHKKTPIVMITSQKEVDKVKEAITSGINGYLIKPVTVKSLDDQLDKLKLG